MRRAMPSRTTTAEKSVLPTDGFARRWGKPVDIFVVGARRRKSRRGAHTFSDTSILYHWVGPSEATEIAILTHFVTACVLDLSITMLLGDYLSDRLVHREQILKAVGAWLDRSWSFSRSHSPDKRRF
jgi:hypothetical protein